MTDVRTARLEAIAIAKAILENRTDDAHTLIEGSSDTAELAHAACGMTAAMLALTRGDLRERILAGWTNAAVGADGDR